MRNIFTVLLLVSVSACNSGPATNTVLKDTVQSSQTIHTNARDTVVTNKKPVVLAGCYQMILKHDTALLQLDVQDSTVTGNLKYNFYEKDDNSGTLKGVLRNDTIYADYTFQSEGTTSVREVVFKIQDDTLVQGFGDLTEQDGKIKFRDPTTLQFQAANPFLKIACP